MSLLSRVRAAGLPHVYQRCRSAATTTTTTTTASSLSSSSPASSCAVTIPRGLGGNNCSAAAIFARHVTYTPDPITNLLREDSAAERIKQARLNAAHEIRADAESDATLNVSVATILTKMEKKGDTIVDLEEAISSSIATSMTDSTVSVDHTGQRDQYRVIAESVAEEFIELEAQRGHTSKDFRPLPFQTFHSSVDKDSLTNSAASPSKDFQPLPFQTLHPSVDKDSLTNSSSKASSGSAGGPLKPLPFQTVHPSVLQLQKENAADGRALPRTVPAAQQDWLEDLDDVSGRPLEVASRGTSKAAAATPGAQRVTGDVAHISVAESLEDVSFEDLDRDDTPRDYMASSHAYASHVNNRNKANDSDTGYGILHQKARREQSKAKQAGRSSKSKSSKEAGVDAQSGSMDELGYVDDVGILNESKPDGGRGGYRQGEHQIANQGGLRARFTEGEEQGSWAKPGAAGYDKRKPHP